MKVVVGFLLLCVVVLNVDAACNSPPAGSSIPPCVMGTPFTADNNCEMYRNYYDCIVKERDSCSITAAKDGLQMQIDSNLAIRHGIHCGAAGITVSLFTLMLALFAAFRQL